MKRLMTILLLSGVMTCFSLSALAQNDKSSTILHFVYIAHEVTTPVSTLTQQLRVLHNDAVEMGEEMIVYLSDGAGSMLSFTNVADPENQGREKAEAFYSIIFKLQDAVAHEVTSYVDVQNIIDLFSNVEFVDDDGNVFYQEVIFDFHVGPSFWALNNNEKVIAHIYHAFNIDKLPREKFRLNIFLPRETELAELPTPLFGDNDINDINNKLRISKY